MQQYPTGSEIALSWLPMRLKILHWRPDFHSWSPTFSHLATEKKGQSPVGACLKKLISDPAPDIKIDILYNLMAMIGTIKMSTMVDFIEVLNKQTNSMRTIEELLVEIVPIASKQFVEILMTTYIF